MQREGGKKKQIARKWWQKRMASSPGQIQVHGILSILTCCFGGLHVRVLVAIEFPERKGKEERAIYIVVCLQPNIPPHEKFQVYV